MAEKNMYFLCREGDESIDTEGLFDYSIRV